jgi:hypothetical protein
MCNHEKQAVLQGEIADLLVARKGAKKKFDSQPHSYYSD